MVGALAVVATSVVPVVDLTVIQVADDEAGGVGSVKAGESIVVAIKNGVAVSTTRLNIHVNPHYWNWARKVDIIGRDVLGSIAGQLREISFGEGSPRVRGEHEQCAPLRECRRNPPRELIVISASVLLLLKMIQNNECDSTEARMVTETTSQILKHFEMGTMGNEARTVDCNACCWVCFRDSGSGDTGYESHEGGSLGKLHFKSDAVSSVGEKSRESWYTSWIEQIGVSWN